MMPRRLALNKSQPGTNGGQLGRRWRRPGPPKKRGPSRMQSYRPRLLANIAPKAHLHFSISAFQHFSISVFQFFSFSASFQRQPEQRRDAQNQQRCPQIRGAGHRDPDAAQQRHIRGETSRTVGQQDQRGTGNDPSGDLAAAAQSQRRTLSTRSLLAVSRRNLATVSSIHACTG